MRSNSCGRPSRRYVLSKNSPRRRSRLFRRLLLEQLEDRRLLTAIAWATDSDGFWDESSNWSPQQVPGGGDDVTIDRGAANPTISIRDTRSVNSIISRESLAITGGTFTINAASQLDASAVTLSGGNLSANGMVTITNTATLDWQAGSIFGNGLSNSGILTISAAADVGLAGTLTNSGTINHTGAGNLVVSGVLNNQAAGTYDFETDADITGNNRIDNAGTIKKTFGSGESRIGPLANSDFNLNNLGGTIEARTGTIKLDQLRGTNTGATWNAFFGAILDIVGHPSFPASYAGNYSGSGGGIVQWSGGQFGVTGETGPGVTFNFPGTLFQWTGGSFTNTHPNHPFTNTGTMTLAGSSDKAIGGSAFNNSGTIIQAGTGNLIVSGTLTNSASGLYDFQSDVGITGNGAINNAGTIKKTGGVGVSRLGPSVGASLNLNNTGGTIDAQSGTLQLFDVRGASTGGMLNAGTGAVLNVAPNGGARFGGIYTGSGDGAVQLTGDFVTESMGAEFNFPAGLFEWVSGSISGGGTGLINSGTMMVTGANDKTLFGRLVDSSVIEHTGTGRVLLNTSAVLEVPVGGLYDFTGEGGIGRSAIGGGSTPSIDLRGTLRKSAGTGTALLDGSPDGFNFNLTGGVIDVQTGRLKIDESGLWQGGTLNASMDAVLELSNGAAMTGDFTGSGAGRVELSGGNFASSDFGIAGEHATLNFPSELLRWTGGGISSGGCGSGCATTLVNAGSITIEGPADKGIGRTGLINEGSIVNLGPGAFGMSGAWLDNRVGATYEHRGDSPFSGTDQFGNPGQILNAGTFKKAAGSGVVDITARLNNAATGVLEVQAGRLRFSRGGDSTGGMFNVSAGAVFEFGGNNPFNMTGAYTGVGPGRIEINSLFSGGDSNNPALLSFPPGVLRAIGGQLLGTIVNDGTFDFATVDGIFTRAAITNNGTWIHSGIGDFVLNANSRFTNNGLYDLQTDADFVVPGDASGGSMLFINTADGTFRKSDGLGTTAFRHDGNNKELRFDNSGTIEVRSGTVRFDDSVAQLSSNSLTDGTWHVGPFSTLTFASGGNITTNRSDVILEGPSSNFTNINALSNNQGSLTLQGGRDFTTASHLTNSGDLLLGPGSIFTVNGNYTETEVQTALAWYRGENDSQDSIGTNHGTLQGTVPFVTGQFGQSFSLDGERDFVSVGNPASLRLQDFTIQAWVKRDDLTKGGGIFLYGQSGYGFGLQPSGALFLTQVGINHVETSTLRVADEAFHHVAVTKSGGTVTFYVDGVRETISGYNPNFSFFTNAAIGARADRNDPAFVGRIDELAIFNRPLDQGEIMALMNDNDVAGVGRITPNVEIEISGRPRSGQFGQLRVHGNAALQGQLDIAAVGGYGPTPDDAFPIISHTNRTSDFSSINGLDPFFTAAVNPTNITLNVRPDVPTFDLDVTSITVPVAGAPGEPATIMYTVANLSNNAAGGSWTDSVYLSRDITYSPDDLLIGRVEHVGGVVANGNYNEMLIAPLPGVIDGDYHVIVIADSRNQLPDTDRSNNREASASRIAMSTPQLTLGVTTNDTIANGRDKYYRLDVPAGGDVRLAATFEPQNHAEFFVAYGRLPTRSDFDFVANDPTQLMRTITFASPQAGPYYVLVHGREGVGTGQPFELFAEHVGLAINGVTPSRGSNVGDVTSTIQGAGFTPTSAVHLVDGLNLIRTGSVQFVDANRLFVAFDLRGVAPGTYDVRVDDAAGSTTSQDAFTVTTGQAGRLEFHISGPASLRAGRPQTVYIDYQNTGETDVAARVFTLFADNAVLRLPEQPAFRGNVIDLLSINRNGPADVLPPGARGTIPVIFLPSTSTTFEVQVNDPGEVLNWNDLSGLLRPASVPADTWNAVFTNFTSQVGTTTGQLEAVLRDNARRLSQLGIYTAEVTRLLAFEFDQANDFGAIASRYALGAFGRGQPSVFEAAAVTAANGDVTIVSGKIFRQFVRQANGTFRSAPDDEGILTRESSGAYRLREASGILLAFRPDGKFDFIETPNGDKLTATYTAGRLTSLADTFGNTMSLSYNAQGRVSGITDAVGRTTLLNYDASGEHLMEMIAPEGTTTFSYLLGAGVAKEHAVSSITFPNGTHTFFEYDSLGRLIRQSRDGNSEPITVAYDSTGGVVQSNAFGNELALRRNDFGEIAQLTNPFGEVFSFAYDADHSLNRLTAPLGVQVTFAQDSLGNLSGIGFSEGQQLALNFDPLFSQLQTLRDARGNTTGYELDSHANLIRITNADSSVTTFAYDARGNRIESVNRRGQTIGYVYDLDNLLKRKVLPGDVVIDYTYDLHQNLKAVTEAAGITAFEYDAADRMTKVTYPSGRFLEFTYDGLGRRTKMEDQDGFVVEYGYDTLGRLSRLSQSTGGPVVEVVEYLYNAIGQLSRANMANGAFTTYQYDTAGRLISLVNHRDANGELSRFDRMLDELGRPAGITSADGSQSFTYDLNRQLTSVALPTGRVITYEYDAAGNRIAVTDAGEVTAYAINNLNQYSTVGDADFTYDADGNVTSRTDASGTTTYAYDAENHLISVVAPGNQTWAYEYDPLGNLRTVTQNGLRTEYLVDPHGLASTVGEYTGGALVAHDLHGLGLVGRVDAGGNANFYHYDTNGNTVQITDPNGDTLNAYSYLPFGETLSAAETVANPFTYNGRYGILATGDGLYHMRNRAYDPALGRFAQADPLNVSGGDANLYRFVLNDPLSFVDPLGLQATNPSTAEQDAQKAIDQLNNLKGSGGETLKNAKGIVNAASKAPGAITGGLSVGLGAAVLGTYGAMALATGAEVITAGVAAGFLLSGGGLVIVGGGILAYTFSDGFGTNPTIQPVLSDQITTNQCLFLKAQQLSGHVPPYSPGELATAARSCRDDMFPGQTHRSGEQQSMDPNEIIGPSAFVLPDQTLPYQIHFENLASATAPAQIVLVTQQLDSDLDWSTFELSSFGFGDFVIDVPAGRNFYNTRVDLPASPEIGGDPLSVDVTAGLDVNAGLVTWTFTALDPTTGDLPANALAGFLPPNTTPPIGQGFVNYTIRSKSGLTTGTRIDAKARIVFDTNEAIDTAPIFSTIDAGAPMSGIDPLSAKTFTETFTVSWSGIDDANGTPGSGIRIYDVFVSTDGEPFEPLVLTTSETSAEFTGEFGHTYGFYSIATDNVGHIETVPVTADTTTLVTEPPPLVAMDDEFEIDEDTVLNIVTERHVDERPLWRQQRHARRGSNYWSQSAWRGGVGRCRWRVPL